MPNFVDKQLIDVPIFASGHLTDSLGNSKDFKDEDIIAIIDAFSQGAPPSVPIKIGHSSDEFNSQVATALGIPDLLVKGEGGAGKGQVRLGEITKLSKDSDGHLIASMDVREPVAKLITDGFLTGLSSEIQFNRKQGETTYPIVLGALSFLGAQRAALSDLPSLQEATMLEDGTCADAVYFSDVNFAAEDLIKAISGSSGSMKIPNDAASSGIDDKATYTVPISDLTRGRQVFASVSAPDEITAKRTALRVVENFLFSLSGPLGTALGVTGGAILSARLIAGKPILGGIKGLIRWKFEENYDFEDELEELFEITSRLTQYTEKLKVEKGEKNVVRKYADHPGFESCLAKAKADGIENPEAHCRAQMEETASEVIANLAKALDLSEWDEAGILVRVRELQEAKATGGKFEEETSTKIASLEHKLRISHYSDEVATLDLVPLTQVEKATKLADLELKAGEESATVVLEAWQAQQVAAKGAKVAEAVLRPGGELAPSEFSEAVEKIKTENPGMSDGDVMKKTMREHPELAASRNGSSS